MRFGILGDLEVVDGDQRRTPTAPKPRRVLALLLLHANAVVRTETLIHELWGDEPPPSAVTTVQTYVYQLRKLLGGQGASAPGRLDTRHSGYVLQVERGQLDRDRFDDLVDLGHAELAAGDAAAASRALSEALGLWRGPALADVEAGPMISAQLTWLRERHMEALQARIEADLALGRHRALVGELKALVAANPLHEWFYGQLMLALHRGGRRAEALAVYHQLRRVLGAELALEPSADLQALQRLVLSTDPAPLVGAV